MAMVSLTLFFVLALLFQVILCYIPAHPFNQTANSDVSDEHMSSLQLHWYSKGAYNLNVSYQLAFPDGDGVSIGPLVEFSESHANDENTPPAGVPWIALINCDNNATNASQEVDIFTLASDLGANASVLYSLTSDTCIINAEYTDPDNDFGVVLDVYSFLDKQSATTMHNQYNLSISKNYTFYNSQLLNDSAAIINDTVISLNPAKPGFMYAVLTAFNATGTSPSGGGDPDPSSSAEPGNMGKKDTATSTIVLYAITGCVSILFCIVITSGVIRAIRHPERYGPRRNFNDGSMVFQSRARGLTRAILDTFPVVKFAQASEPEHIPIEKDMEQAQPSTSRPSVQSHDAGLRDAIIPGAIIYPDREESRSKSRQEISSQPQPSGSRDVSSEIAVTRRDPKSLPSQNPAGSDVVPAAIGRQTCPICIVDFEEGDDIRILPCEGQHRFHQQCVDPWLLELSSSCPICRHDFLALENLLSQEDETSSQYSDSHATEPETAEENTERLSRAGRFSRYIRMAIQRRGRYRDEPDPTDLDMPRVSQTTL